MQIDAQRHRLIARLLLNVCSILARARFVLSLSLSLSQCSFRFYIVTRNSQCLLADECIMIVKFP